MDNIIFPKLKFDKPGVYRYTIKELTPSDRHWRTDRRVYPVVVTVEYGNDGKLVAKVYYPNGFPKFVNKYCKPKCCCGCCFICCKRPCGERRDLRGKC